MLLLSVQPSQAIDPAFLPALQELLSCCRACLQQRSTLELEAKDHKCKGITCHSITKPKHNLNLNTFLWVDHLGRIIWSMTQQSRLCEKLKVSAVVNYVE